MKHILIANKWRTPDGTVLFSKHRHDYVCHNDANGDYYFLDGGNDYFRMSKNDIEMKNESVYADDNFDIVRKNEMRGTYAFDPTSRQKMFTWIPIYKLSDAHLCNCILDFLKGRDILDVYNVHVHLYVKELVYRYDNNIFVEDHQYTTDEIDKEPEYLYKPECSINDKGVIVFNDDKPNNMINVITALNDLSEISDDDLIRGIAHNALLYLDNAFDKLSNIKEEDDALLG